MFKKIAWTICVAATAVLMTACAGSNGETILNPEVESLSGTWNYQVTNAYSATFTNCTGDAAVLEGQLFYTVLDVDSICTIPTTFDVVQTGGNVQVLQHDADCAGETASAVGTGAIANSTLSGAFEISTAQGMTASHSFVGSANGGTIAMEETTRTFYGAFSGACSLDPPLLATATIQ